MLACSMQTVVTWIANKSLHHDVDQYQPLQLLKLCCRPYACRLLAAVFFICGELARPTAVSHQLVCLAAAHGCMCCLHLLLLTHDF